MSVVVWCLYHLHVNELGATESCISWHSRRPVRVHVTKRSRPWRLGQAWWLGYLTPENKSCLLVLNSIMFAGLFSLVVLVTNQVNKKNWVCSTGLKKLCFYPHSSRDVGAGWLMLWGDQWRWKTEKVFLSLTTVILICFRQKVDRAAAPFRKISLFLMMVLFDRGTREGQFIKAK